MTQTHTLGTKTETIAKVKSIDLKYSKGGKAILKINVETKRFDDKTTFFNVVAFDKLAENIADNLNKNDIIKFNGSTMTSSFKNKQGYNVYQTQVLLDGKGFEVLVKGEPKTNKQKDTSSQIDISNDDLPF